MQDILPPVKKPKKSLKVILFILSGLFIIFVTIGVTYFLTRKGQAVENKKTNSSFDTEKKEEGEFVYITSKAGLNMRQDASTSSAIIYTLPYRAKVKVEKKSQDGKWYKGNYDDQAGWFAADYVAKEEPEDLTKDWQSYESSQYGYSLKYPENWQKKVSSDSSIDFSASPNNQTWLSVFIIYKDGSTIDKEKATLADAEHSVVSENLIVISSIKGKRFVVQKTKGGKVVSATDIILLEKDGKLIRIEGPADNEEQGDIFNLITWTIKFKVL